MKRPGQGLGGLIVSRDNGRIGRGDRGHRLGFRNLSGVLSVIFPFRASPDERFQGRPMRQRGSLGRRRAGQPTGDVGTAEMGLLNEPMSEEETDRGDGLRQ